MGLIVVDSAARSSRSLCAAGEDALVHDRFVLAIVEVVAVGDLVEIDRIAQYVSHDFARGDHFQPQELVGSPPRQRFAASLREWVRREVEPYVATYDCEE